jgi:hypothetical protein
MRAVRPLIVVPTMSTLPTRPVSIVPRGTALARVFQALTKNQNEYLAADWAEGRREWRTTPHVAEYLKANVEPGTVADSGWAAPIVRFGIATEFMALLRDASAFVQLRESFAAYRLIPKSSKSLTAAQQQRGWANSI